MSKKEVIREKRFVLDDKEELKNKWASNKGELLTLSYDYFPVLLQNSHDAEYKDVIEVAVEEFNQLGLARLVYRPAKMLKYDKDRPLDSQYLKLLHKNPILFSHYESEDEHNTALCYTRNKLSYKTPYQYDFLSYIKDPKHFYGLRVASFAEIDCNTQNKLFQRFGVGIILAKINHLFSIKQASTSFFPASNDSLLAPFSIQHYDANVFPDQAINRTRISELLDAYQVGTTIKDTYLYLLDKYAGHPLLYTAQDITALATAVYRIAPDSLVDKKFNFFNYPLIKGVYLPKVDKLKLTVVADALIYTENFNYPILAQENATIIIKKSDHFIIDLVKELKAVSLFNHLGCSIKEKNFSSVPGSLSIPVGCTLIGKLDTTGVFEFSVALTNGRGKIKRPIKLVVEEKNRVLVGVREAIYPIKKDRYYHVNLQEVCEIVTFGRILHCDISNREDLTKHKLTKLGAGRCRLEFKAITNFNLKAVFFNGGDSIRCCDIQFSLEETLGIENEHNVSYRSNRVKREYSREVTEMPQFEPVLSNQIEQTIQPDKLPIFVAQFTYCVSLPFCQGALEGLIDSFYLDSYKKSSLIKLLPRLGLWYLGYFDPKHFLLMLFASFFEGTIKNNLKNKVGDFSEILINIAFFLGMTELEYSFSELWLLADQPRIFPAVTDKLNQLFAQLVYAPMIKTLGYMTTVSLINCYLETMAEVPKGKTNSAAPLLTSEHEATLDQSVPIKSSFVAAVQDAYQTVFSRKTFKLFSFFKVNSSQAREVSSSEETSIELTPA